MHRFIHLSLVVALLMGSFGFRVDPMRCAGKKSGAALSLSMESGCCCSKKAKEKQAPCNDATCVMQRSVASTSTFSASSQQVVKTATKPVIYPSFTQSIRPVLLETLPQVALPPPISGRDIGILHQRFLI
ncbi:hypothetical protein [Rufibacter hautae]|uniref:Uncharacterized protein n=1 Tax=Rufibacter hautae TaxID=2595005 RepID=A0A5B6THY9_9BACT|nr:hypothetical protein [Rufibacter hautae]KAA3440282.1 hypothetical protein FOA19_06395 [Rufibacter hautae]